MGIRHDVEEGLEKYEVTKIEGQPTDEDLNQLTKELTNAAGSVATQNGGGEHGHVGMVVDEAEYVTFSHGNARFVVPTNQERTQQLSMPPMQPFARSKLPSTRPRLLSTKHTWEFKTG